jgi:glutaconyl-CoA/methylmalonyl-CoA decarboxylase subunit gamma
MKSYKIQVNGKSYDVTVEEVGASAGTPQAPNGASPRPAAPIAAAPAQASVAATPAARAAASGTAAPRAKTGAVQVKASMPGTLLSFKVKVGQAVKAGEVILILEAMKMENEIVAPVDGVVTALLVSEGASVNTGDVLVEIA